ncbi:MAG: hypothetical protein ABSH20_00800 [Tepidisphaeraceae bacterium]|jgi:hypothetical protein
MKRRLLDILAVLSLLLSIAVVILWVRSYWIGDRFYHSRWQVDGLRCQESASWLLLGSGRIGFAVRRQAAVERPENIAEFKALAAHPESLWHCDRPPATNWHPPDDSALVHRLGFWTIDAPMPPGAGVTGYYREWGMPLWPICLALAVWPARRCAWHLCHRSRRQPGLCPVCGYDLRATPERCPECGTVFPNGN